MSVICLFFLYEKWSLYLVMSSRVTIVLDDTNAEKLRLIQAKMIKSTTKSVSFSHVLNLVITTGLKKFKV